MVDENGTKMGQKWDKNGRQMGRNTHFSQSHFPILPEVEDLSPVPFVKTRSPHPPTGKWAFSLPLTATAAGADARLSERVGARAGGRGIRARKALSGERLRFGRNVHSFISTSDSCFRRSSRRAKYDWPLSSNCCVRWPSVGLWMRSRGRVTVPLRLPPRGQGPRPVTTAGGGPSKPVSQAPAPEMRWKGGRYPSPSRAPSLCPATVSLTPSASFNGVCNRQ